MFEKLKRLYLTHRIGEAELTNAVAKGWITEDEKQLIMSENTAVSFYANEVMRGAMAIESVPIEYRTQVKVILGEV